MGKVTKMGILVIVALGAFSLSSYPREPSGKRDMDSIRRMIEQRQRNVSALIRIIREGEERHGKEVLSRAMRALGECRAPGAVGVLVANIDFMPTPHPLKGSKRYGSLTENWPAAFALTQIGLPAVGPCVDLMLKSDDPHSTRASVVTLCILGYKMRNAYLRDRAGKTKDEALAARLLSLIVE